MNCPPKHFGIKEESLRGEHWEFLHLRSPMNTFEFEKLDAEALALIDGVLHESLKPVVNLIGLKLTLDMVREFGGQVITIPRYQNGKGAALFAKIEKVIGVKNTFLLSDYFYGDKFTIPKFTRFDRVLRNLSMIRDFEALLKTTSATLATSELVRKYEMTTRQVDVIVNGKGKPTSTYKRPCQKVRTLRVNSDAANRL